MTAQMEAPVARPHPCRRSGIAEFAAGIVTGSTNVRIAPVAPAERYPLNAPEKRVAKPTAAIAPVASHGLREQRVPSVMNAAPTHPSPRYATKRVRGGPPNSASTSIANDPKAAKIEVCGCPITLSANANTAGMTIAARAALFSAAMSSTVGDDTSAPEPTCGRPAEPRGERGARLRGQRARQVDDGLPGNVRAEPERPRRGEASRPAAIGRRAPRGPVTQRSPAPRRHSTTYHTATTISTPRGNASVRIEPVRK